MLESRLLDIPLTSLKVYSQHMQFFKVCEHTQMKCVTGTMPQVDAKAKGHVTRFSQSAEPLGGTGVMLRTYGRGRWRGGAGCNEGHPRGMVHGTEQTLTLTSSYCFHHSRFSFKNVWIRKRWKRMEILYSPCCLERELWQVSGFSSIFYSLSLPLGCKVLIPTAVLSENPGSL